jgi:hypothetical protein
MEIEILDFIPDEKGYRKGYLDFRVKHSPGKVETFRNVLYFEKDNKKWLDLGNVLRNGKWIKRYEREPSIKPVLDFALDVFEQIM